VSPNQNDTIAIGKFDDVCALKDKTLEGVSPGLRLDATYGADRIKSPNFSPRFSGHAEEEVVNAADANITAAGANAYAGREVLEIRNGKIIN
jgi:hypothetical protein